MTARRALLDGLARGPDIFEVLSGLAPLHPRNDTFPGEVFLRLADLAAVGIAGRQRSRGQEASAGPPFKIIAMALISAGVTCPGLSGVTPA
jgi:hypothetical protein